MLEPEWKRVIFAHDFGENGELPCPSCGEYDGTCECPGPTQETSDGTPFLYKTVRGVLLGRPPDGYHWNGEELGA